MCVRVLVHVPQVVKLGTSEIPKQVEQTLPSHHHCDHQPGGNQCGTSGHMLSDIIERGGKAVTISSSGKGTEQDLGAGAVITACGCV